MVLSNQIPPKELQAKERKTFEQGKIIVNFKLCLLGGKKKSLSWVFFFKMQLPLGKYNCLGFFNWAFY